MRLAKRSFRSVKTLARRRGIEIEPPHPGSGTPLYKIGGRWATVKTAYHGGDSIVQHLTHGAQLALVQAGASGEWYAVLPARTFFEIMQPSQAASESIPSESENPDASRQ